MTSHRRFNSLLNVMKKIGYAQVRMLMTERLRENEKKIQK
ncbi:MAG: hypothetical protein HLUCCO02_08185 [Idiomarinaceae bacterium HL-53]|nr:MAG: hypothetical protein HLUCCO02_08185 [Idiomarinaceae bacterium HL-53]